MSVFIGYHKKMKKEDLTEQDYQLVAAAISEVKKPILEFGGNETKAKVGSALRLDSGEIIASVNIRTDVGSLSLCAEPIAIAEARKHVAKKIDTIVAVYQKPEEEPRVIPPCGNCREFIADYAHEGFVILREPKSEKLFKVRSVDLLPLRYADFWDGDYLI